MKYTKPLLIGFLLLSSNIVWGQKNKNDIPKAYDLENLGDSVNSVYGELGPVITPDGQTIYFVIDGQPNNVFGADDSQEIWYSTKKADGTWSQSKRMPLPFNIEQYNSVESVSSDGSTLLIRGGYKNGKLKDELGYSFSHRTENGWTVPQFIEIQDFQLLNKGRYSNIFLANDGKTMFLAFSEVKGSEINDLYVSMLQNGNKWSRPVPIGSDVNTTFSDDTPFLAADGKTLYFSSDRPGGLGSHDIYMSRRLDDSWQKWSTPVNLGAPVNTESWDTYYSMDATGEYAYLISDKNSRGETDIVRVKLKEEFRPEPVVLIVGKVFNSKTNTPLDAMISYEVLPDGTELGIARSNPATGEYKIVLPYGKKYGFRAKANGYVSVSDNIDLTNLKPDDKTTAMLTDTTLYQVSILENRTRLGETASGNLNDAALTADDTPLLPATMAQDTTVSLGSIIDRNLSLVPIEVGQTVRMNNLFFDFDKVQLREDSYPELDHIAQFMEENPRISIEIEGHTDALGTEEYNQMLSSGRVTSVKDYLSTQKNIDSSRIIVKSYGESKPISENDTEEGRSKNRRVEFKIIKN